MIYRIMLIGCTIIRMQEKILDKIVHCITDEDYEDLLKELADKLLNEESLKELNKVEKVESVYNCIGKFKYVEYPDDDEYDDEYDDDEEEYDDEECY